MKQYIPPFLNVLKFKERIALIDGFGKHSYNDLFNQSKILCKSILKVSKVDKDHLKKHPLKGEKVAFLCQNDHTYVTAQWGAWMTGCTAVPLSKYHPTKELEFIIKDCRPKVLLCTENYAEKLHKIGEKFGLDFMVFNALLEDDSQVNLRNSLNQRIIDTPYVPDEHLLASWNKIKWEETDAQIVYTSGTTGRPKGVVTTFANICSQVNDLNKAWNVTSEDGYLHVLPLHHVHGIVNNLLSPLSVGASVTMLQTFSAEKVWWHLLEDETVNVFHAVPTIYSKLIDYFTENLTHQSDSIREILMKKFRLMVSGSAALPVPVLQRWEEISGHVLLERYGMTEIGMALTNPLEGRRVEGAVGKPFPSLKFRIMSEDKKTIVEGDHEKIIKYAEGDGSLVVKGTSVFKEYLNLEKATNESFDEEGWFITGDTAVYDIEHDVIRIMGRTSVDIINSAGYKMSALEIEKHLLSVDGIHEVAVVALPDDVYGEIVCAVLVASKNHSITLQYVQEQCKEVLAKYKIPRAIKILDEIPKNAMGKINKKELIASILQSS